MTKWIVWMRVRSTCGLAWIETMMIQMMATQERTPGHSSVEWKTVIQIMMQWSLTKNWLFVSIMIYQMMDLVTCLHLMLVPT